MRTIEAVRRSGVAVRSDETIRQAGVRDGRGGCRLPGRPRWRRAGRHRDRQGSRAPRDGPGPGARRPRRRGDVSPRRHDLRGLRPPRRVLRLRGALPAAPGRRARRSLRRDDHDRRSPRRSRPTSASWFVRLPRRSCSLTGTARCQPPRECATRPRQRRPCRQAPETASSSRVIASASRIAIARCWRSVTTALRPTASGGARLAMSRCSSPAPTQRSSTSTTPAADQRLPDVHEAPVDDAAITEAFRPPTSGANGPIR